MWASQDNFVETGSLLPPEGARDRAQVVWLGGKGLNPLSHLASLLMSFGCLALCIPERALSVPL